MKNVLVVPTEGFADGVPSAGGSCRLSTLGRILEEDPRRFDQIAIIGGWPDPQGETLAEKYRNFLEPTIARRLTIVDGSRNNTVDDLTALIGILRRKYQNEKAIIHFISSSIHFRRIRFTIAAWNYEAVHIESGEALSRPRIIDLVLERVNKSDPFWRGFFGCILRKMAQRRADAYRRNYGK